MDADKIDPVAIILIVVIIVVIYFLVINKPNSGGGGGGGDGNSNNNKRAVLEKIHTLPFISPFPINSRIIGRDAAAGQLADLMRERVPLPRLP